MKSKIILLRIIILASFILSNNHAFAASYVSEVFIADSDDAQIQCNITCSQHMTNWTGRWWITGDPASVCECFYGWPYCPVITVAPGRMPCIPPY